MGLLIGGNVSGIEIVGNFFVSNMRRNPVVGGGASAFVANNFIYNPGRNSVHVYEGAATKASLIGNVTMKGPDTTRISPFQIQGNLAIDHPRNYAADNHCCDGRAMAEQTSQPSVSSRSPFATWKLPFKAGRLATSAGLLSRPPRVPPRLHCSSVEWNGRSSTAAEAAITRPAAAPRHCRPILRRG
jgi:hypothetical protein